jgi:hypothetical protein
MIELIVKVQMIPGSVSKLEECKHRRVGGATVFASALT